MSAAAFWTWQNGSPPGPQIAPAGVSWTLTLPLQGSGQPPLIQWIDLPKGITVQPLASDPLTFVFEIPADQHGVCTLRLRRGDNALEDRILLKITPAAVTQQSRPPALAAPPVALQPASMPTPEAVLHRAHLTPELPPIPVPPPLTTGSAAALRLTGDYEIQVYRGNTPLAHLTRPLLPHHSLLVGKFSASQAVFPDIDLRQQFVDAQTEACCSREQARIYWSDGQIVLHNIGKSAITLADGQLLLGGAVHHWRPGAAVTLPGGLSLQLEACAY